MTDVVRVVDPTPVTLTVQDRSAIVDVQEQRISIVEIGERGPQGPQGASGPSGPSGPAGEAYVPDFFESSTPPLAVKRGDQWIVAHGLDGS